MRTALEIAGGFFLFWIGFWFACVLAANKIIRIMKRYEREANRMELERWDTDRLKSGPGRT